MCTLTPASPCRVDLDCGAFGELDAGHTFAVAGVTFWFVENGQPTPANVYPIDAWSSSRTWAISNAISQATPWQVKALDDDGTVHIFGPAGMVVTSDSPGVIVVPVDPGSEARCEP